MSGKGSGRRPTNEEQYMSNWDTIFGKRKVEQEKEDKEKENELSEETNNPDR